MVPGTTSGRRLIKRGKKLRAAIVHYSVTHSRILADTVRALAKGMESQGHDVMVVDARTEGGKSLTSFAYIAVGTVASSIFSRNVSVGIEAFFKSAGMLSGKRSYAFISGGGLWKASLLISLMKIMESEGMYLKKSDIIRNPVEAETIGARLHVDKFLT